MKHLTRNTSLRERIRAMTDQQLEELAAGEALAMADSSRLEGLTLDEEQIRKAMLSGYHRIRTTAHHQSASDDQRSHP